MVQPRMAPNGCECALQVFALTFSSHLTKSNSSCSDTQTYWELPHSTKTGDDSLNGWRDDSSRTRGLISTQEPRSPTSSGMNNIFFVFWEPSQQPNLSYISEQKSRAVRKRHEARRSPTHDVKSRSDVSQSAPNSRQRAAKASKASKASAANNLASENCVHSRLNMASASLSQSSPRLGETSSIPKLSHLGVRSCRKSLLPISLTNMSGATHTSVQTTCRQHRHFLDGATADFRRRGRFLPAFQCGLRYSPYGYCSGILDISRFNDGKSTSLPADIR